MQNIPKSLHTVKIIVSLAAIGRRLTYAELIT